MDLKFYKIKEELENRGRLILFLLFTISCLLFVVSFWLSLPSPKKGKISAGKAPELNLGFFEKESFKKLKFFKGAEAPEEKGRSNPFTPVSREEAGNRKENEQPGGEEEEKGGEEEVTS